MLIDFLLKSLKPGDKLVYEVTKDLWEVTKDARLVRQSALSEEAKFLRHLKNLGHEDVESSALETGGRWEKAVEELQAHESRSSASK